MYCEKTFTNYAMKPLKIKGRLKKPYFDKKSKKLFVLRNWKKNLEIYYI